ncbi:MAG: bifunctional enoyl-CoA hydratase/phosphate acetyltransferase [Lachnospirales bacterium]
MKKLDDFIELARKKENSVIAVAAAEDKDVLTSIMEGEKLGICTAILVGNEVKIREIALEIGMSLDKHKIVNIEDSVYACEVATKFVSSGEAAALMKGLIDTSYVLKAALNKEWGLRTGSVMSHIAVYELATYKKPLFLTDAAININPDFETKKQIIENSIKAIQNIGVEKPKVGLICAKEKVNPKMQSTVDADELSKVFADREDCVVEGPIALDGAISKEACDIKGIDTKIGGDVDLLVLDNIEAGNALYKALTYLAGGKNGGVVLGTSRPVILTSRSDSSHTKLISMALGLLM